MAAKKETATKKAEPKKIILASSNPNLSVFHLGVQFTEGKFETTNRDIANILLKYAGVFEI